MTGNRDVPCKEAREHTNSKRTPCYEVDATTCWRKSCPGGQQHALDTVRKGKTKVYNASQLAIYQEGNVAANLRRFHPRVFPN